MATLAPAAINQGFKPKYFYSGDYFTNINKDQVKQILDAILKYEAKKK